jgi:hypothetical protein
MWIGSGRLGAKNKEQGQGVLKMIWLQDALFEREITNKVGWRMIWLQETPFGRRK